MTGCQWPRSPAASLSLIQGPFQAGAPTTHSPWDDLGLSSLFFSTRQDRDHDDRGTLAGLGLTPEPSTFWVSVAPETTLSPSPLSPQQLECTMKTQIISHAPLIHNPPMLPITLRFKSSLPSMA